MIKSKRWAIFFTVFGVFMTVLGASIFFDHMSLQTGLGLVTGICWIIVGVANLRRLQKAEPQ
jgi:drug/metabolite transporter (DMT)-like permease